MACQASSFGSDGISDSYTVFIDTSLDTHFITVVSSSETVSDLKNKLLCEHAMCFPHIGKIKIHGLKVKRRGKFYYLSESMLVKSVFHGVNKNWFITVDASSLEDCNANKNFINPLSNKLLAPGSVMNIALDSNALPESRSSPLPKNVDDIQLQKQIDSCDQRFVLAVNGGDGSRKMNTGVNFMKDTCGEAMNIDANDKSFSSMEEKCDFYDKGKEIKNAPKEGAESIISKDGVCSKPGRITSGDRAAEAMNDKKKRRRRKADHDELALKQDNAEASKHGMHRSEKETEEPDSSLRNANGIVSSYNDANDGPTTNSSPEANEGSGTDVQKLVGLDNVKSRENSVGMLRDQSLKGNQQVEPSAKRRRTVKQAKTGDGDLLKDDGRMVSESNKAALDNSTISQKSLAAGKQRRGNATLDGLSLATPESVDSQLVSPSNKKRKGEKKSAKRFNLEAAAVPSCRTNDGVEHFEMPNNSSNSSENSAAELSCRQHVKDAASSEPDMSNANNLKDKQSDTAEEINLRPSSLEMDAKKKEAGNLEGGHVAPGAAIESNTKRKRVSKDHSGIFAEDNTCAEVLASNRKEEKNKISKKGNEIHNNQENHFSSQNGGFEEQQTRKGNEIHNNKENHFSSQNGGFEEHQNHVSGQNSRVDEEREFSLEFPPKAASSQDDLQLEAKEPDVGSKLLEASENVDPPKSSKNRKKSKKTNKLASLTPSSSVTDHVKGFVSSTSPAEPHKVAKGGHTSDTLTLEESNRLPQVRKEVDNASTSLVTDKEINDVIQNVVESVQQIGKDQEGTESIHGKSRKKSRKKQNSDAKLLSESIKQIENLGYNAAGEMEVSSEVKKADSVVNTGCINDVFESTLECGTGTAAEINRGIQCQEQKLESNSRKWFPEAVTGGITSISGCANDVIGVADVPSESDGINFNDYFTPKKRDLETVVSGEMHVDEANKTNGSHDMAKDKKPKKNSNKESSKASDRGVDPPVSSNRQKVNSVLEEALISNVAKPTGIVNGSKGRKAELNLKSSNPRKVNSIPEEAHLTSDAKLTGKVNGSKSKKAESNPVSSNAHKVNSVPQEARQSKDAKSTGIVNGSKSKKAKSNLENSEKSSCGRTRADGHQSLEDHKHNDARKTSAAKKGGISTLKNEKSLVGVSGSIFKDDSDYDSSSEDDSSSDDDSDAATRTPSDASLSSDYSDEESNADFNMSQYGSSSRKTEELGRKATGKPFSSEMSMTLDKILRSSSSYKKAKLTAAQSQAEDIESQPLDFVPDSKA